MEKNLSDRTLDELWQHFPIILTEPKACWQDWYLEEEKLLREILPQEVRIHHIGSTSIKGIWAKPIIDILVEMDKADDPSIRKLLEKNGYLWMAGSAGRMDYNKGYTTKGFAERVFHLHLRPLGDHDELYFRDYLNEHPQIAKEYEALKLSLWKPYEHNRDGYTEQKTEFVRRYTQIAKTEYGERYAAR